ncbi:hypothetical protein TI04_00765 [Achromatium sp. WMS2]|nr:hypothetical protein TI04_00765 [Achromatium sp. WMS2]
MLIHKILITIATMLAFSGLSIDVFATSEPKGRMSLCPSNTTCFSINAQPTAAQNTTPTSDIILNYRYSDSQGNGKTHILSNNSVLHSGDKFTIEVTANKNIYLYIFHFDSYGELKELVSHSGHANYLTAGTSFVLPNLNKHFFLDDKVGLEIMHTIVSEQPLDNLMAMYQQSLLGNDQIQRVVQKGIGTGNDSNYSKVKSNQPVAASGGRILGCLGGAACRETFTIFHMARSQD